MKKQQALDFFGSQKEIAKKLLISGAAVSKWRDIIPERAALKLDRLTNGELEYDPEFYRA